MMSRKSLSLIILCWLILVGNAYAQQRGGRSRLPAVGAQLPVVTVYDEKGKKFSTKSLRGHHSVLVFGCLT